MTFRHAWLVFILAALSQAEPIDVSISPPGGLDPEQVPQLILITFYGNTETPLPKGLPYHFFRVKAVH